MWIRDGLATIEKEKQQAKGQKDSNKPTSNRLSEYFSRDDDDDDDNSQTNNNNDDTEEDAVSPAVIDNTNADKVDEPLTDEEKEEFIVRITTHM